MVRAILPAVAVLTGAACLEPLPPAETCESPTVAEDGGCVCPEGFFARVGTSGVTKGDCLPCDGEQQFVTEASECAPCVEPNELVNGKCLECPLPGAPATQCFPLVGNPNDENGCIALQAKYDAFRCLTGETGDDATAACLPVEPAPSIDACYAPREVGFSNCPAEVKALGENVHCYPLAAADIAIAESETSDPCACRSAQQLARCDGVGVILGGAGRVGDAAPALIAPIIIGLPPLLEDQGRFGVYVRARGFALPFLVQNISPTELLHAWAFFSTQGYDSLIGFGPEQDGIAVIGDLQAGLAFGEGVGPKPETLLISPQDISGGADELILFELDCLIPFVIGD